MAETAAMPELDAQYRAMREHAGVLDRSDRGKLSVSGPDAAEYLQSQLTNDVEGLAPGQGCYAALLDAKGHIRSDMRALRLDVDEIWLDTEPTTTEVLLRHLDTYRIGREATVEDRSADWAIASLIGPAAAEIAGCGPLEDEHAHRRFERDGIELLAVATNVGIDLIAPTEARGHLHRLLSASEADPVTEEAVEILRVEAGRPRFGREMSERTMPAEAGIVERAVSFEKGCYIGQEPVARLHYRGRPNRRLRGLALSGPARGGEPLSLGDREVGRVGTACISPALGPIALAIVRREAEAGDRLEVGQDGLTAELVELPFGA